MSTPEIELEDKHKVEKGKLELGNDDVGKEPPPKKHREVDVPAEPAPSNPPQEHTKAVPDGENSKQLDLSINLYPKLVKALSKVPYSALYGVLWPIIVEQASFETREQLRHVDDYFAKLCHPYGDSDRAKGFYVSYHGNLGKRKGFPFVLDLSFGVEWRCWSADKCGFNNVETFRAFCALGNIDPDTGCTFDHYPDEEFEHYSWVWMSRTKDILFEASQNPLDNNGSGYCHSCGVTGIADKAIAMYDFMHDKHDPWAEEDEIATVWEEMEWGRNYI